MWKKKMIAGFLIAAVMLFNVSAVLTQAALRSWSGREPIGWSLLPSAIVGWFYVAPAANSLRELLPEATRPQSGLALAVGVLKLKGMSMVLGLAFAKRTKEVGRRATHGVGVMAIGRATVSANIEVPDNAFFRKGQTLSASLRHANAEWDDDAALDLRGAALRLSNGNQSLDLVMNTGERSQFWDTGSLMAFLKGHQGGKSTLEKFYAKSARARAAALDGLRRAPSSYSNLHYYGQLVFRFASIAGAEHLARYRLVPLNPVMQSGLPSESDQQTPWEFERSPEDLRPRDYLRQEFRTLLAARPVLAQIEIAAFAAQEATLAFNIGNAPPSLSVLRAWTPQDFNSIGWYRTQVYSKAQQARGLDVR